MPWDVEALVDAVLEQLAQLHALRGRGDRVGHCFGTRHRRHTANDSNASATTVRQCFVRERARGRIRGLGHHLGRLPVVAWSGGWRWSRRDIFLFAIKDLS